MDALIKNLNLQTVLFLGGKRIATNTKKHKREEKRNHSRRPNKRRKLNNNKRNKKRSKNKKNAELTDCEIEEEGEDDTYGGLPYHFHLATHCEPKFNQNRLTSDEFTDIKTLLQSHSESIEAKLSTYIHTDYVIGCGDKCMYPHTKNGLCVYPHILL